MRAIIYVRQSLAKDELGIQRQELECRSLCTRRKWDVTKVVADNSVSAFKGTRKGYDQVMQLIESRSADVIVVYRLDRLMRRMTDLEALIDLSERTGVQIATVQGDLDLTNSTGRLLGRILASVARSEVETKSERHKLANAQKAKAGKPHGSRRPYGYEADLVTIRESEAQILRQIAQKIIAGWSCKEVAYWLNKEGYLTTMGKPWYPITVRNMLVKKRYHGIVGYNGVDYPAAFPGVFDTKTSEALLLAMRLKANNTPAATKYLLTGLLYCGKCGTRMNGEVRSDGRGRPKRRIYFCRVQGDVRREHGCGGVRRNADALENFIKEAVIYRLDSPELARLLVEDQDDDNATADLLDRRKTLKELQTQLEEDYAVGDITRIQFKHMNVRNAEELAKIDEKLDAITRPSLIPAGQTIREAWNTTDSNNWKRQLINLAGVDRIIVHPSDLKPFYKVNGVVMRFNPEAIEIKWLF